MASQFEYGATQATQPVRDYADDDAGEAGSEPPPRVWGRLIRFGTLEAIDLVADTEFVFGRRRESQIVLSHPQVSNKHCTIKRATASHTAVIQDWSTNGTFLNGIKLDKQAATTLPPSAVITLVHKIPRADALELAYIYQDAPLNARPSVDTDIVGKYYISKRVLGKGSFAEVREAICLQDGQRVAVKVVSKKQLFRNSVAGKDAAERNAKYLLAETLLLKRLSHPAVVRIYDVQDTVNFVYILLELATEGDLFHHVRERGRLDDRTAKIFFRQMLLAVEYLHGQQVTHRDLKRRGATRQLENVLLQRRGDAYLIKLTDFGLAKDLSSEMLTTLCGTPYYIAPEILHGKAYGKEVDCWSLGIILFVMLAGYLPFNEAEMEKLYKLIMAGQLDFDPDIWSKISSQARELVEALVQVDPTKRMTVSDALKHPWLQDEEVVQLVDQLFQSEVAAAAAAAAASTPSRNNSAGDRTWSAATSFVSSDSDLAAGGASIHAPGAGGGHGSANGAGSEGAVSSGRSSGQRPERPPRPLEPDADAEAPLTKRERLDYALFANNALHTDGLSEADQDDDGHRA